MHASTGMSHWASASQITDNTTDCSRIFQAHNKENQSFTLLVLCKWNPPVTDGFHSLRTSNTESVSMTWNHVFMRPWCAVRILIRWNRKAVTLTLNVRGPSYLGLTRSISWLLMPWLITSPGHQQPWYWFCRIGRFLSYLRKDFNYLRRINVEKWHKM